MIRRGICLATGCDFDLLDAADEYVTYCADQHTARTGHAVVVADHMEPPC